MLENLLRNAWKFTGSKPQARVEFVLTELDGTPTYFVRDNGVGCEMAYAGKLLGAFQRLHRTSEFPDTGIGLTTVQRTVRRRGGAGGYILLYAVEHLLSCELFGAAV